MDSQELTPVEKPLKESNVLPVLREPEEKTPKQKEEYLVPVSKEPEEKTPKQREEYLVPVSKEPVEKPKKQREENLVPVSKEPVEKPKKQREENLVPVSKEPVEKPKKQREENLVPVSKEPVEKPKKQREENLVPVSKEPEEKHNTLKDDYIFPVVKEPEDEKERQEDDYVFPVSIGAEENHGMERNDSFRPVFKKPEFKRSKKRDYSFSDSKDMEEEEKRRRQEGEDLLSFLEEMIPEEEGKTLEEVDLIPVFKNLISTLQKNNIVLDKMVEKCYLSLKPTNLSAGVSTKDEWDIKRSDNVRIALKVTFMKVTEIETVSQKFTAEVLIQAKWYEPKLDHSNEEYDPDTMWDPKLVIMNQREPVINNRVTHLVIRPENQHAVVLKRWRVTGYFTEYLELEHFPIDVQDLTISVSSDRSEDEVALFEDKIDMSYVYTNTFEDAQEWFIYDHVETVNDRTTADYASAFCHPILQFQCRVGRKLGYFIWNIVFIVMLINVLSFTMYSINPDNGDRLAVLITLFLTSVTFKFVVKSSLPTLSYHTYLDLYLLSTMVFLGIHAILNASIKLYSRYVDYDTLEKMDRNIIAAMGMCMTSYHIGFAIYVYFTALKRRRIMQEKDRDYRKRKLDVQKRFGGV